MANLLRGLPPHFLPDEDPPQQPRSRTMDEHIGFSSIDKRDVQKSIEAGYSNQRNDDRNLSPAEEDAIARAWGGKGTRKNEQERTRDWARGVGLSEGEGTARHGKIALKKIPEWKAKMAALEARKKDYDNMSYDEQIAFIRDYESTAMRLLGADWKGPGANYYRYQYQNQNLTPVKTVHPGSRKTRGGLRAEEALDNPNYLNSLSTEELRELARQGRHLAGTKVPNDRREYPMKMMNPEERANFDAKHFSQLHEPLLKLYNRQASESERILEERRKASPGYAPNYPRRK